jgi:hypothetical protein
MPCRLDVSAAIHSSRGLGAQQRIVRTQRDADHQMWNLASTSITRLCRVQHSDSHARFANLHLTVQNRSHPAKCLLYALHDMSYTQISQKIPQC